MDAYPVSQNHSMVDLCVVSTDSPIDLAHPQGHVEPLAGGQQEERQQEMEREEGAPAAPAGRHDTAPCTAATAVIQR